MPATPVRAAAAYGGTAGAGVAVTVDGAGWTMRGGVGAAAATPWPLTARAVGGAVGGLRPLLRARPALSSAYALSVVLISSFNCKSRSALGWTNR